MMRITEQNAAEERLNVLPPPLAGVLRPELPSLADEIIMAISGHISREMLQHYSHIRTEAKRKALEAIATKPASGKVNSGTEKVAS